MRRAGRPRGSPASPACRAIRAMGKVDSGAVVGRDVGFGVLPAVRGARDRGRGRGPLRPVRVVHVYVLFAVPRIVAPRYGLPHPGAAPVGAGVPEPW